MTRYSITVTLTPKQAIDAEHALAQSAFREENGRLFSAAHRVSIGLQEAGWEPVNVGTEDEPKWGWRPPEAAS